MSKMPRGIRLRGDKFFVDVTLNGERRTATCDTLDDAVSTQARFKLELTAGVKLDENVRPRRGGWTIHEAVEHCIDNRWADARANKFQALNARQATEFFKKSTLLVDITYEAVLNWKKALADAGNSNSTIAKKLSALRTVMKEAKELNKMPCELPKFPVVKPGQGRVRFLSDEEEASVLQLLDQWGKIEHWQAFIALVETGARHGELWAVQKRDVNLRQGVMLIYGEGNRTKTDRCRSIRISKRLRPILEARMGLVTAPTANLFPFSNPWMRHVWDRVRATMELEDDVQFVSYIARHTCCSRLVMQGVPLPVVQQWMGHTNIATTMRYAHLCPTTLDKAVLALDAWRERQAPEVAERAEEEV